MGPAAGGGAGVEHPALRLQTWAGALVPRVEPRFIHTTVHPAWTAGFSREEGAQIREKPKGNQHQGSSPGLNGGEARKAGGVGRWLLSPETLGKLLLGPRQAPVRSRSRTALSLC